jgi:hypothetical protein
VGSAAVLRYLVVTNQKCLSVSLFGVMSCVVSVFCLSVAPWSSYVSSDSVSYYFMVLVVGVTGRACEVLFALSCHFIVVIQYLQLFWMNEILCFHLFNSLLSF